MLENTTKKFQNIFKDCSAIFDCAAMTPLQYSAWLRSEFEVNNMLDFYFRKTHQHRRKENFKNTVNKFLSDSNICHIFRTQNTVHGFAIIDMDRKEVVCVNYGERLTDHANVEFCLDYLVKNSAIKIKKGA